MKKAGDGVVALKELHAHLVRNELHTDPSSSISQVLLSYSSFSNNRNHKSSNLHKALVVFNQIQQPTTYLWNAIIRAFSLSDQPSQAISIYHQHTHNTLTTPDNLTFLFLIKACTRLQDSLNGRNAHLQCLKLGFHSYLFLSNAFIRMYGSCADFTSARRVFDEMSHRDLVSWNSLICGYSQNYQFQPVLALFRAMQIQGIKSDAVTMVKVVLACTHLGDSQFADSVVNYIESNNVKIDVYLGNTLIDLYKCRGSVESARNVFDQMPEKNIVSWNTMIVAYAKAGNLIAARELFEDMPVKDVISWTSMINAYSQSNKFSDALVLFREMMVAKVKPDEITVTSVLSACAHLGTLDFGKSVHEYISAHNIKADIHLGNSLIDMYFKCGCMENALDVFKDMREKDAVSWNSVITGLAVNGYAKDALSCFSDMLREGVQPSDVTFVGVLVACTHAGLVDEGLQYFESIEKVHRIQPTMKHYGCVVDMLSRSGFLDKAYEFIMSIPVRLDANVWRILLSACKLHDNVVLAETALKKLLELDPSNSGNYVLLSNIYADADRWDDAVTVRKLMKETGVQKAPGCSSIELDDSVHAFRTQALNPGSLGGRVKL
ncbi:Pentatricopeptide repeat-containing protein [Thalictrum thalictroides]|uniref:Pentatricopeptide repeat-containing protein n=1 Tax=Thalictrum thalictroides TaxID=46969 RepID=A0A7J6W7U7_THATH|nr:Pentatricopeptide repeat-containing protein [Thalictrum thalictroides]